MKLVTLSQTGGLTFIDWIKEAPFPVYREVEDENTISYLKRGFKAKEKTIQNKNSTSGFSQVYSLCCTSTNTYIEFWHVDGKENVFKSLAREYQITKGKKDEKEFLSKTKELLITNDSE